MRNKLNCFIILFSYVFLYFFSNNFIYSQSIQESKCEYLIPMGNILQIDAELKNIIVRNEVQNCPLKIGDSILKIENNFINSYDDFSKYVLLSQKNKDISVLIQRDSSTFCIKCDKDDLQNINFNNIISGFATLTYINPSTNQFGAVAHPINIGSCKRIPIKDGHISFTENINIKKSYRGNVGCLNATKNKKIGEFNDNTNFGIKGSVSNIDLCKYKKYKVANIDEIKLGSAQIILQTKNNTCQKYDVEVISIENQKKPSSKGIKIKIVDNNLLKSTGGIVQGMSGTPIVQGDKIIGAISHALENNPEIGYGVHIRWMLQN